MSSWSCRVALPVVGLILVGCGTAGDGAAPQAGFIVPVSVAATAGLPEPRVGDAWRHERGATSRVTAVEGELVTIRRGKSTTIVRPRNPFLPAVVTDGRRFHVTASIDAPPDALFPLAAGNTASFREIRRSRNKVTGRERVTTRQWHCAVGEPASVTVPLGTFETLPVRCESPANDAFMRIARTYEWHFAPAIGQVVRERLERFGKAPRERRLVRLSTTAPLARGAVFETALQSAFETRRSGEPASWHDAAAAQAGTITIARTIQRDDGTYCRDAEIALGTKDPPFVQTIRACRSADGKWLPQAS